MVLVETFYEAGRTQQVHVIGAKVLKRPVMDRASLGSQLTLGLHQSVRAEGLLLLVLLEVPGAERHLTLQATLHRHRWLIDALVAEHLRSLKLGRELPLQVDVGGPEALHDVAQLEVFPQGVHVLEVLAAFWATRRRLGGLAGRVGRLPDASMAVAVAAREEHRVLEELRADGAAQLLDKRLHRVGERHDESREKKKLSSDPISLPLHSSCCYLPLNIFAASPSAWKSRQQPAAQV